MADNPVYVTFSKKQQAFHYEYSLDDMIEANVEQLLHGYHADFVVVGCAETREEAHDIVGRLEPKLRPDSGMALNDETAEPTDEPEP